MAYLHLMGLSAEANSLNTSYALIYATLEALEGRQCRYANLGGGRGLRDNARDGLYQFKKHWTNDRRTSLLCGEILDPRAYGSLVLQVLDVLFLGPALANSGTALGD